MGSTHACDEEDDATTFTHVLQLTTAFGVPITLKAVIELDVLEIISRAGPDDQLSSAEIASKIPSSNHPQAPVALDRMLRYLASHSVLSCSVVVHDDGSVERRYGLTSVCKFFIKNQNGASVAPLLLMGLDKVHLDSWQELKYAVVDGVIPFTKAHGMTAYEYHGTDPRFNRVFNQGMSNFSTLVVEKMLDTYTGFRGLRVLVDVGGGVGATLHMIVSKYPQIKGINFDLTHVISDAPSLPGVEHVWGDMFASVPSGDAIFMKWILHNWSAEHCLKLLKNCLKALPDSGKVIIVDRIIPEAPEANAATQAIFFDDLSMLTFTVGGKERTKKEYEFMAKQAGFSRFNVACSIYNFSVMELLK